MGSFSSQQTVSPDGSEVAVVAAAAVVVKRGRGRPPGKRNKATLIAQAKLLAQQQAKAKVTVDSQSPLLPAGGRASPAGSSVQVKPLLLFPLFEGRLDLLVCLFGSSS